LISPEVQLIISKNTKAGPDGKNEALSLRGGRFWMLDRERAEFRSIYKGGAIK